MPVRPVLIIGSGHLAYRIRKLAETRGHAVNHLAHDAFRPPDSDEPVYDTIERTLRGLDLASLAMVFLVDDDDERNLQLLIALISLRADLPITASLFNENIAPHLQAAHPDIRILNPARIAAPAFIDALQTPLTRSLHYTPAMVADKPALPRSDNLIAWLVGAFVVLIAAATTYFRVAEGLSWLNALYFVTVTVATVGYGDISLRDSTATSKLVGIGLILGSTVFIWMIFSLTVDRLIKRRDQLALGRKKYAKRGHVILCGLGRLGYFIAEGLLERGENLLIVEKNESSPSIEYFRSRGADVYIGDARLPRVLQDVGVTRAKALYSVVSNDIVNLEIGLNARSFTPGLRLILRIFDQSISREIREHLDIHLTFSMSDIADEKFLNQSPPPPPQLDEQPEPPPLSLPAPASAP